MTVIGFDADGVLLDSHAPALQAVRRLLVLLGVTAQLGSQGDYERHFGPEALNRLVGKEHAGALRMAHRLAMRQASAGLPLFHDTLAVVDRQPVPCIVITAALAEGVRTALGTDARLFQSITGFEIDRKPKLLAAAANRLRVYVTDTIADIQICQSLRIPVIAVTWGYDAANDLAAANPTAIARTADELATFLARFHFDQHSKIKEY